MFGRKKKSAAVNSKQQEYRDFFKIEDKVLIYYEKNNATTDEEKSGYIIFINMQDQLDYVDLRNKDQMSLKEKKSFQHWLGRLKAAEATPCINLTKKQMLAFRQHLAQGYLLIFQREFNGIDDIIRDALHFLKQRNMEESRELIMLSAGYIAFFASLVGVFLYIIDFRNFWFYGVIFGILGSFVSIWSRYGKEMMTGLASVFLHVMEATSRMFIGAIAAVMVMFMVRSGLMLNISDNKEMFFLYCIFSFAAGFSERFVPSLIERLIEKELGDKGSTETANDTVNDTDNETDNGADNDADEKG